MHNSYTKSRLDYSKQKECFVYTFISINKGEVFLVARFISPSYVMELMENNYSYGMLKSKDKSSRST